VRHRVDVVLGILELGAPEEGVERACLDADAAVHAQGVIDRKPVEHLDRARTPPGRWLVLFLVSVDVDAPVGTLARALVADGAVRFLESDHAARARRQVWLDVRILLRHGRMQHRLERHGKALQQAEPHSLRRLVFGGAVLRLLARAL
jgi:hypothetical protein